MFKVVIAVIFIFFVPAAIPAVEFELKGTVVTENFFKVQAGRPPTRAEVSFSVSVSNCYWLVRTERQIATGRCAIEVGSEGEAIYSSSWFSVTNRGNERFVDGTIRPRGRPYVTEDLVVSLLWFAYASECYFSNITSTNRLEPLWIRYIVGGRNLYNLTNFTVPAIWSLTATRPVVPDHAVFFEDGLVRRWNDDRDSWWRPPVEERLPTPYENGYTGLVYTVEKYIAQGATTVPERFQLQMFGTKLKASDSNDLYLMVRHTGLITNFADRVTVRSFLPRLPSRGRILDERFVHSTPNVFGFAYDSGGRWLDENSVKRLPEYAQQMREQARFLPKLKSRPQNSATSRKRVRVVFLIFVLASSLPIVYYFFVRRSLNSKSKENNR